MTITDPITDTGPAFETVDPATVRAFLVQKTVQTRLDDQVRNAEIREELVDQFLDALAAEGYRPIGNQTLRLNQLNALTGGDDAPVVVQLFGAAVPA